MQIKLNINSILKTKGITIKQMCVSVGITEQGYAGFFRNKTLRFQHIEDIARFLGVDWQVLAMNDKVANVAEPMPSYGKKYIEQRVQNLEFEVEKLKALIK